MQQGSQPWSELCEDEQGGGGCQGGLPSWSQGEEAQVYLVLAYKVKVNVTSMWFTVTLVFVAAQDVRLLRISALHSFVGWSTQWCSRHRHCLAGVLPLTLVGIVA